MKLWLLTQNKNTGYDTFDAVVVAASTKEKAQAIAPDHSPNGTKRYEDVNGDWCQPEFVKATYLGKAKAGTKTGIILASFNAG